MLEWLSVSALGMLLDEEDAFLVPTGVQSKDLSCWPNPPGDAAGPEEAEQWEHMPGVPEELHCCSLYQAQLYLLQQRWLQKSHALLRAVVFSCEINLGLGRIWHFIKPRNAPAFPKSLTEILAWTRKASSSLGFVSMAPGVGNHCGVSTVCTALCGCSHTLTLSTASDSWDKCLWLFPKKGSLRKGCSSLPLSWGWDLHACMKNELIF